MGRQQWIAGGIALLLPFTARAAFERLVTGGQHVALAGATVGLPSDPGGALGNPAGLIGIPGPTLSASVTPALYGIAGLQVLAVHACSPFPWGAVGVSASWFGVSGYQETDAALSLAWAFGPQSGAALRVHALLLSIAGYGTAVVPACDAGVQLGLTDGLVFGCLLNNVMGARIGKDREALPQSLECGFSFTSAATNVTLCASVVQELLTPADWRLGVAYSPFDCLVARTGVSTDPALLCGGIGLVMAPVAIDYAVTHHWQLGLTHHVSVTFSID